MNWDEIHQQHQARQQTVRVPMRAALLDEISVLEDQIRREVEIDRRENREPVAPQLAQRIRDIEDELAASEVAFTFRALGGRALQKLIADHPPTDEQVKEAEAQEMRVTRNEETFQPALLHASCVTPEGSTLEGWQSICAEWSLGQFSPLWQACLLANFGGAEVGPKSQIASEILRG